MTVSSRVFGISIHEVKTDALVPFAGWKAKKKIILTSNQHNSIKTNNFLLLDMLNHRRPKSAH